MPLLPAGPALDFDPDAAAVDHGEVALYGVPCSLEDALVHVISVPWQATASYRRGTRHGPAAIVQATMQVDLADVDFGATWRAGMSFIDGEHFVGTIHDDVEADALAVIAAGGVNADPSLADAAARVDTAGDEVHAWVRAHTEAALDAGRIPAVLGGDHSTPYGLISAVAERHPGLGVLHLDAHADLRDAFLGFRWSHASIFHNVLSNHANVSRLVGVGWRDMGSAELARIAAENGRIEAWTDQRLADAELNGRPFRSVIDEIVASLPPKVHISIDIDGLDPVLCPNTGTPVPGGVSWRQFAALLKAVAEQREVVSFDLCEVSPGPDGAGEDDTWDAIVGARALYKLAGCAVFSRRRTLGLPPDPAADDRGLV